MPRVSSKKSYRGRRYAPYKRRSRNSAALSVRPSMPFTRNLSGFPLTIRATLKYHQGLVFQSVSGSVSKNAFRANGMFDPDETGTGHQPMGFDQLAGIYARYKVVSSRIKVTFSPVSETAATSDWVCGVIGQSGTTIDAGVDVNCEQPHSTWSVINGRLGGPNQKTLYLTYSPEKHLGLTNNDADVGATVSADPGVSYKYMCWCADRQSTGTTNMNAEVEISYDVIFHEPVFNAGS